MMRFYSQPHRFYCGIDLHARTMYVVILDDAGNKVFDRNLPAQPASFLTAVAPFRDGLVVGVECMFSWYWLADLCQEQQIAFVLGHLVPGSDSRGEGQERPDRRRQAGAIAAWRHGSPPESDSTLHTPGTAKRRSGEAIGA
jgi:hypothetical protein